MSLVWQRLELCSSDVCFTRWWFVHGHLILAKRPWAAKYFLMWCSDPLWLHLHLSAVFDAGCLQAHSPLIWCTGQVWAWTLNTRKEMVLCQIWPSVRGQLQNDSWLVSEYVWRNCLVYKDVCNVWWHLPCQLILGWALFRLCIRESDRSPTRNLLLFSWYLRTIRAWTLQGVGALPIITLWLQFNLRQLTADRDSTTYVHTT